MPEPDPDRGHIDSPARRSRVCRTWWRRSGSSGAGRKGPFDDIALLVRRSVDGGRPSAPAAPQQPVAGLVRGLGNRRLNPAPAQGSPDLATGVGLVAQDPARPGPGPARAAAFDLQ